MLYRKRSNPPASARLHGAWRVFCRLCLLLAVGGGASPAAGQVISAWSYPVPPGIQDSQQNEPGFNLPLLVEAHGPGTPRIAAHHRDALAGESLLLTGENLGRATIKLWQAGRALPTRLVRNADGLVQVTVPKTVSLQPGVAWLTLTRSGAGDAVRLGAPELWWGRAEATRGGGGTLRLFGKHLLVPGQTPRLVVQFGDSPPQELPAQAVSEFELRLDLSRRPRGKISVWSHNGTGGIAGWSHPVVIEAGQPVKPPTRVVILDPKSAEELGFRRALALVMKNVGRSADGAIIQLPAGDFELRQSIIVRGPAPIVLRGVGVSDPQAEGPQNATRLMTTRGFDGQALVRLDGAGAGLEDLELHFNHSPSGVQMNQRDQVLRGLRVIRAAGTPSADAVVCRAPGEARQVIEDCELRPTRLAVRVVEGTHGVRISNNRMFGRYQTGSGTDANAITSFGNRVIIEDNFVTSEDRRNGQLFCRMALFYKSDITHTYVARNTVVNVGPHPSVPGMDLNTGEVVLYHARGRYGGAVAKVVGANAQTLTLDTSIEQAPGLIAMIANGPAAGQLRVVRHVNAKQLELAQPWRVTPSPGDAVLVFEASRQNHVVHNQFSSTPNPDATDLTMKRVGVMGFFGFVDNVIANNTITDATAGVFIIGQVNRPCAWNQITGNTIDRMSGDTVSHIQAEGIALIMHEYVADACPVDQYMGIGTRVARNTISNSPVGVRTAWSHKGKRWAAERYLPAVGAGSVGDVIENNVVNAAKTAVVIGPPNNRILVRANDFGSFGRVLFTHPERLNAPLLIDPDTHTIQSTSEVPTSD